MVKILTVDDEPGLLILLDAILANEGYDIVQADDPLEALDLLKENPKPDLIISDVMMPEMTGFEFCKKVRQQKDIMLIPFIFLTGEKAASDLEEGQAVGADAYLTKPFDADDLLEAVEESLKMSRNAKEVLSSEKPIIAGRLGEFQLVDLIQIFELGQKTGILELENSSQKGEIYFDSGRVINAVYGDFTAETAVYHLLVWEEGDFSFAPGHIGAIGRKIDVSTQGLIMEGLRLIDEGQIK